ncbi:MAG: 3-deoxy-D-manno-octulosonic acid transferase [Proteobacteria bacterium]|nr:3-deoxy-D-manno-octulosonic acid transferase [Pseudomonadota bacterium]
MVGETTPALVAYRAATRALHPLAAALLGKRARAGKEDPARLAERLGRASVPRPTGPLAWLHGASVGETLSLLPLISRLQAARPGLRILVTSGTTTSAELLARRLPSGVLHQYAPLDTPPMAARFLEHWRPDLAVFVESDLWPNLLLTARQRGTRLALLSARLSDRSLRNWSRTPGLARRLLGAFDLVQAQDERTATALARLGARDDGRLNLKLAGDPLPVDGAALDEARQAAAGRPVLLAASTHPGEDELVLASAPPEALVVIVPRHPARGPALAGLAATAGLRSRGDRFGDQPVHIADTLGELGLWFRLADAALIGGSLLPGVGGHNPLEPARLGLPFASGPHVDNWRSIYDELQSAQAVAFTPDAAALAAFWRSPPPGQAERARAFAQAQSGQLDAAVARLLPLLP